MIDESRFKLHCWRVVVEASGKAVVPRVAREEFGMTPDIVFIRNDSWRLGAPEQFEDVAYRLWKDHWTHFHRKGELMRPIGQYTPKE